LPPKRLLKTRWILETYRRDAIHGINYAPITEGWNYVVRIYRPQIQLFNGSWIFPRQKKWSRDSLKSLFEELFRGVLLKSVFEELFLKSSFKRD
jgi:hypothetical protein